MRFLLTRLALSSRRRSPRAALVRLRRLVLAGGVPGASLDRAGIGIWRLARGISAFASPFGARRFWEGLADWVTALILLGLRALQGA